MVVHIVAKAQSHRSSDNTPSHSSTIRVYAQLFRSDNNNDKTNCNNISSCSYDKKFSTASATANMVPACI